METSPRHDALAVLCRAGAERDAFCAAIGATDGDDAGLVRALLRAAGRPGRERAAIEGLVHLATVMRALDAAAGGRITLDELRTGLAVHDAATDGFARLGPTRALVRTARELLERSDLAPGPVLRQLGVLHTQLTDSLCEQLTGTTDPAADTTPTSSTDAWREEHRITDPARAAALDALAAEWLDDDAGGARRAAWVRRWTAVPVPGLVGDDDRSLARITQAVIAIGATDVTQVKLVPPARYTARGTRVTVGDGRRRSYGFPATAEGVRSAAGGDRGASLFTAIAADGEYGFVLLEDVDHHLVAAPAVIVEQLLGRPPVEALAAFREHVEAIATSTGDDPPERLAEAARTFGHGRRW